MIEWLNWEMVTVVCMALFVFMVCFCVYVTKDNGTRTTYAPSYGMLPPAPPPEYKNRQFPPKDEQ